MTLFEQKRYSIKDIDSLIKSQAEESLNLEFKSSGALDFTDSTKRDEKKTEMSRDVSAMANSEGGILIYGLREDNHVAKSKTFIDGNKVTKEQIEQILQNRINRPIPGLKVFPIRENNDLQKSIYLIKIPESDDSPHMAFDGVYYKRNNFNRIPFMEYEVRREYLRTRKTKLEIPFPIINKPNGGFHKKGDSEYGHFRIWLHIENVGKSLEKDFKQEIRIPKAFHNPFYDTPNPIEKFKTHSSPDDYIFSIPNEETIFPNEALRVCSSYIYLKKPDSTEKIKMKLYYSGGITEKEFTIQEMFEAQYKREKEINFDLKYQKKK